MIVSDYLEKIVDFEKPVLVVGPGLRHVQVGKDFIDMPMDVGLLWFAEKMAGKGRVDVFDVPPTRKIRGCFHGIDKVEEYMGNLAQRVRLGDVRYIMGDIAEYELPHGEYGAVWDHATLSDNWFSWHLFQECHRDSSAIINQRAKSTLANYERALTRGGHIVLTGGTSVLAQRNIPRGMKQKK